MDRHGHRLHKENAAEIRRLYKRTNLTQKEIADKFEISVSLVNQIVNGRIWKT